MIDFYQLLYSRVGKILISIIWGLGLSALFKKACIGRNCKIIEYKAPNPEEIRKLYYKYGNSNCYKYTPYLSKCE